MCLKATCSVLRLFITGGLVLSAWTGGSFAQTRSDALSPAAAKLREIEAKAARHDFAARKNDELQQDVQNLRQALFHAQDQIKDITSKYTPGRLNELERKSMAYGYLREKVEFQDKKIEELERQLAEEKCLTTLQAEEIQKLREKVEQIEVIEAKYQAEIRGLKNTINELRLGNFEYYTVQRDGETLEDIAGLEMIYGDPSKSEQLKQANAANIKDLDNLKAGEVLIVPRFRESGSYLW